MRMRFSSALVLVGLTGFTALSAELLWTRVYYFLSATRAYAFAAMLCAYLLGLALGSLWSLRAQAAADSKKAEPHADTVARLVLWANILAFLLPPVVSWIASARVLTGGFQPYILTYPLVAFVAAYMGSLLPLICHLAVPPDERVGSRLSYLYLANIIGSGAGSLLTGFVLMEFVPLKWIAWVLLVLGLLVYAWLRGGQLGAWRKVALIAAAGAVATPALYWQFWERMQHGYGWGPGRAFAQVIESRSGVITVDQQNVIAGGGVYDGVIEVTPQKNAWLVRAYALSAMHPAPEEVLVVGLSGGSWAQITAANPAVKKVTCIEINHAYRQVIASHDEVKSLLTNPKVEIIIDDGRRWLERHPDRKFDAILMNTTHHWREFASNLLSKEFLAMAATRLKRGGIFQYNATDSARVHQTALEGFEHVCLLLNNIVISNQPISFDKDRWESVLRSYVIDAKPVFVAANPADESVLQKLLGLCDTVGREPDALIGNPLWSDDADRQKFRVQSRAQLERACRAVGATAITDDNLGHEYRWW
jgi:spermidine synthase